MDLAALGCQTHRPSSKIVSETTRNQAWQKNCAERAILSEAATEPKKGASQGRPSSKSLTDTGIRLYVGLINIPEPVKSLAAKRRPRASAPSGRFGFGKKLK